jgi:hypothetical protein
MYLKQLLFFAYATLVLCLALSSFKMLFITGCPSYLQEIRIDLHVKSVTEQRGKVGFQKELVLAAKTMVSFSHS